MVDHTLSGPLPEELGRLLVRHRVVERIAQEFAASGELERLLDSALASPQSREVIDRVLASDATKQALERVLAGPGGPCRADVAVRGTCGRGHDRRAFDRDRSRLAVLAGRAQIAGLAVRGRGEPRRRTGRRCVSDSRRYCGRGRRRQSRRGGGRRRAARVARSDAPFAGDGGDRGRLFRRLLAHRRSDARDAADGSTRPPDSARRPLDRVAGDPADDRSSSRDYPVLPRLPARPLRLPASRASRLSRRHRCGLRRPVSDGRSALPWTETEGRRPQASRSS